MIFPEETVMELREFVRDALVNVIQGIKEAQKLERIGGYVAPDGIESHQFPPNTGVVNNQRITSTVMQFDVAVTAERSKGGGAETGVRIAVVEAKIGGKVQLKDIQVSRVQFSVPIILPKNLRNWASEADAVPDRH